MSSGILCIGECMVEFAPDPGATVGLYRRGIAGDTFNTAVYLARLQPSPVSYMTALGTDSLSDRMLERFRVEGLDVDHVRRLDDRVPGLYIIETDADGERTFHYWRSTSAARAMLRGLRLPALVDEFRRFAAIYFSGITLAILAPADRQLFLDALTALRAENDTTLIAFDSNYRSRLWPDTVGATVAYREAATVSNVVLSTWDDDAVLFADDHPDAAARRWQSWGAKAVVVRTGAAGSLVLDDGTPPARVAAEPCGRPVDTTGGGDSFNAGFLAAYLDGATPAVASGFGHRVAGHVVNCPGAIMAREAWDTLFKGGTAPWRDDE